MNRRNTYAHISDKRYEETLRKGNKTEREFMDLMISRGNVVLEATDEEDMYKHIDFFVNGDGVDIKGNKKSYDIWLEVQNVFGGNGWLCGEAKWIVFDLVDVNAYYIYKRMDLLKWVVENTSENTTDRNDYLKYYTREKFGGKDRVVRCNESHINHLLIQKINYAR